MLDTRTPRGMTRGGLWLGAVAPYPSRFLCLLQAPTTVGDERNQSCEWD